MREPSDPSIERQCMGHPTL